MWLGMGMGMGRCVGVGVGVGVGEFESVYVCVRVAVTLVHCASSVAASRAALQFCIGRHQVHQIACTNDHVHSHK